MKHSTGRDTKIHLGFEVNSGARVDIPLRHLAVTGQTQESGKTTTLEGLITRSGLRALAFVTKRGESSFGSAALIQPYFRDDAGGRPYWEFVESIVASTMGQKMKFERAWIAKAAKGASSLRQVRDNLARLQGASKRSMDQDLYMLLGEYLDIVLPQLELLPPPAPLDLQQGLNVMDLTRFTEEMQMLIVRSAVLWVHEREHNVVTIMPEAWKFIPESRLTPVKPAAERLIREGAGLGNFVWMDSQDIAGVWKLMLRAATVWIVGVQREANEIKRTLANIPAGIRKPKAEHVATLRKGEFFACFGAEVRRVYVQPAWMSETEAQAIAIGTMSVDAVAAPRKDDGMYDEQKAQLERENVELKKRIKTLEEQIRDLTVLADQRKITPSGPRPVSPDMPSVSSSPSLVSGGIDVDVIDERRYQAFKSRLLSELPSEPKLLRILAAKPELEVQVERKTVSIDGASLKGRMARLLAIGFFREPRSQSAARSELKRTGTDVNTGNLSKVFTDFVVDGFLTNESEGYRMTPHAVARVVERS